MGILDTFSKRKSREAGETVDIFAYDSLPAKLRVQIVHIARDAIGDSGRFHVSARCYSQIHNALCREFGLFDLMPDSYGIDAKIFNFVLDQTNTDRVLDVVQHVFEVIEKNARDINFGIRAGMNMDSKDAINELNARFLENAVGYQFESGRLIRMDSRVIHADVMKPVLSLLRDPKFSGANEEFLSAHDHYRHSRYKECSVDALKAFESTMKAIFRKREWPFKPADPAKALIEQCFSKGLVPSYLQSEFSALRGLLESGLPVVRNKEGGHGQGADRVPMPPHIAHYALNLAATNILFLFEADAALK